MRPLLEVLGIVLIVAGTAMASRAAALVVAGVLLITVANKATVRRQRRKPAEDS